MCLSALVGAMTACGQEKQPVSTEPPPEVVKRWAAFAACVLGTTPLQDGETPSARMRASELTTLTKGANSAWPKDCILLADKTVEALRQASTVPPLEALRRKMQLLSGTQADMFLSVDDGILVDSIWELAREADLAPVPTDGPPEDTPTAPAPAKPPPASARILLGKTKALGHRSESSPDLATRRLVWGGGDTSALACRFTSGKAPFDTVTCEMLEGRSAAFVPLSGADASASHYFDPKPEPMVLGSTMAEPVGFDGSAETFVFSDGSLGEVQKSGARAQMLRRRADGKLDKAPLRGPAGGIFLDFAGTAVTWIGPLRGTGNRPLSMQSMGLGRAVMTADREIGEVPPGVRRVHTCRRGDDVSVAILGEDIDDAGTTEVAMVHRKEGKWSRPVSGRAAIGKSSDLPPPRMYCHPDESASLLWRTADARVGMVRCGETCTATSSEPITPVGKVSYPTVALMGDEAVLVRITRALSPMTGVTDSVLIRRGKVAELAQAPDLVLVGDEDHGGLEELARGLGIIATDGAAVVLIRSRDEIYGIRITPEGPPGGLTRSDG